MTALLHGINLEKAIFFKKSQNIDKTVLDKLYFVVVYFFIPLFFEYALSFHLSYFPVNNLEESPRTRCSDDVERSVPRLNDLIPSDSRAAYDVKELIGNVVDDASFLEIQEGYARNLVVGFARMHGRSVGIVANQPDHLAGALDTNASRKGARFVRFCDAFNIFLITFVDVPGFLPGKEQEVNGIISGRTA